MPVAAMEVKTCVLCLRNHDDSVWTLGGSVIFWFSFRQIVSID